MTYKTPHKTYIILLLTSLFVTGSTYIIKEQATASIVASLGAGGIASVCVAWLLDVRNAKERLIENKRKTEEIMNQLICIYQRLLWDTASECYGYCTESEVRSFQSWLLLLSYIEKSAPKDGPKSMKTRCERVSSSIVRLQHQIELLRSQSATLIFEDFPNIEQALKDMDLLWVHCWGTLKTLESENYKAFCDTTYILYTDFIKAFPQYQDRFPMEYSVNTFHPLL